MKIESQKGISLIEILVVVLICGLIVGVIINIVPSVNLIGNSNRETLAKQVASQKIEDIRTQGYDNLGNGVQEITDSRLSALQEASATATISDCPQSICTNSELLKKVDVLISWIENSSPKNFQVTTFVGKGGLK